MEIINQLLAFIKQLFDWWFVVMPWEQAIHVRWGKKVSLKREGVYLKIPFFDKVFIQTIRTRMVDLPMQTVTTKDNKTVTIKSAMGYRIEDMFKLYNTITHPDMTLSSMVMSNIADHIRASESTEISPKTVEAFVSTKINGDTYGLKDITVRITSWADVKTFRIIQDGSWLAEGINMDFIK